MATIPHAPMPSLSAARSWKSAENRCAPMVSGAAICRSRADHWGGFDGLAVAPSSESLSPAIAAACWNLGRTAVAGRCTGQVPHMSALGCCLRHEASPIPGVAASVSLSHGVVRRRRLFLQFGVILRSFVEDGHGPGGKMANSRRKSTPALMASRPWCASRPCLALGTFCLPTAFSGTATVSSPMPPQRWPSAHPARRGAGPAGQ